MGERFDDEHVAVAVRAVVIAAEVVLTRLRDPDFLAVGGEPTAAEVVDEAPPVDGAGSRLRALALQGGQRAREGLAAGMEKWAAERPGSARWETQSVDERCDWWMATLGRAVSVLAALPGLSGAVSEQFPVGELLSAAGQGLLLCAIAQEHGILDRDDQVELLGAVVLDRELASGTGRAQRRRAQDEAGALVPELADRSAPSPSPTRATGLALVRMGRSVRTLQEELDRRPQGHAGQRAVGALPLVGVVGQYRSERHGLRAVSEQGRAWCRTRAAALGPAVEAPPPAVPAAQAPPAVPAPLPAWAPPPASTVPPSSPPAGSAPSSPPAPAPSSPPVVPGEGIDAGTVPIRSGAHGRTRGAGMEPVIGTKVKAKHATAWLTALAPRLYPGEVVTAVSKTNVMRPICDGVVVTNARVLAFFGGELERVGPRREVSADDIARADVVKKTFGANTLVITTRAGEELSYGDIPAADQEMLLGVVRHLGLAGVAPDVRAAVAHQREGDRRSRTAWGAVEVIGTAPSEKAWKAVKDHCSPDEVPWFVVGAGTAGVLAAFADRLMILKVGGMTSAMAGSLGGGRVTTFPYAEVTGIEYNSGMLTGVLEVLTPSYSGAANKDYWRGTQASRNADANDPWTLSNTLPMARELYQRALPRLNEMRARIGEAKRPTVVVAPPAAPVPAAPVASVADELGKLAGLRDQGILSGAEFDAAKQRVLAQHGLT